MKEAVIVSAVRTAVGKAPKGTLKNTRPDDLAAAAKVGLRTAHIAQVDEFGKNTGEAGPLVPVDVSARNFEEFAAKMVP